MNNQMDEMVAVVALVEEVSVSVFFGLYVCLKWPMLLLYSLSIILQYESLSLNIYNLSLSSTYNIKPKEKSCAKKHEFVTRCLLLNLPT